MTNNIFIGMDLHKNSSTFSVKDKEGKLIETKKVPTEPSAIKGYLRKFRSSTLVMEPVSQWYFYADLIQGLGIDVHLAHPKRVKAIAEARIKTDKIDANVLCDLLRTNFLPEAYFSTPEVRFWKEMVRFRASLINFRTQLKNKIHSILFKNAIRHPFANLFSAKGRKWLEARDLQEPFEFPLQRYLSMIDMIDMLVEEADRKVEQVVSNHPQAQLLTSIPGIGYVSGLTIIGEIGDIHRFRSAKKLMG
jgi:transposase